MNLQEALDQPRYKRIFEEARMKTKQYSYIHLGVSIGEYMELGYEPDFILECIERNINQRYTEEEPFDLRLTKFGNGRLIDEVIE